MNTHSKTLVALDVDTEKKALALAKALAGEVAGYKVGLELINAAGFGLLLAAPGIGAYEPKSCGMSWACPAP